MTRILNAVATYLPVLENTSKIMAEIDVYCSFAHISATAPIPYCKPEIL